MKNKMINKTILSAFCLIACLTFASCSDWTDIESVTINEPSIGDQNPELYAKYLQDLREYKKSNHKVTYAWFDNSEKVPFNRAQRIDNVPDSIDVLLLKYPDGLVQRELTEIDNIRNLKSMKVMFTVSYDAIKSTHEAMLAQMVENGQTLPATDGFPTFLADTLASVLKLVDKYSYDGISLGYEGKNILHMTEAEKAQYIAYEEVLLGAVTAWYETKKASKTLVFEGKPQYLVNKAILNSCKHIILPSTDATNASKLTYNAAQACVDGVPTDRFVVTANTNSLDKTDTKTGFWADGSRAIISSATWAAASHPNFTVAGVGIQSVNNDYFNVKLVYQYTRNAISIMNPPIKN